MASPKGICYPATLNGLLFPMRGLMLQRYSALAYSLMRIVAGALFACHGAQKLFGAFGGTIEVHDAEGLIAGLVELFGGGLISLGISLRLPPLSPVVRWQLRISKRMRHEDFGDS